MKLSAEKRAEQDAASLRRAGRLPAVMYNKQLNVPVSIDLREFDKVFRSQGTSHVIDLDVDGKSHEVLVKEVQMNKRKRIPQHVDFYAVTAGQEVHVYVHLEFMGTPAGVRDGGQSDVKRREVEIIVLPRYIPERVELDVSDLQIGESLHVSDVEKVLPKEATIVDDPALTVITILAPRLAEEAETAAAEEAGEAAEPEVIGQGGEEEDGEEE